MIEHTQPLNFEQSLNYHKKSEKNKNNLKKSVYKTYEIR